MKTKRKPVIRRLPPDDETRKILLAGQQEGTLEHRLISTVLLWLWDENENGAVNVEKVDHAYRMSQAICRDLPPGEPI
jgi:hypothetical protein